MNLLLLRIVQVLQIAIIVRAVISWIRADPSQPWVRLLYRVTDPLLNPARRLIPPSGGVDFSPLLVLIVLELIVRYLL